MVMLSALGVVLALGVGLYALMPHPPRAAEQLASLDELREFLARLVGSGNPPGLAAVAVKDGVVVFNEAFGHNDGPGGLPAQADSVYHWWSMTKIVTAVGILQLQEQGRLDLDDTVVSYLPWFEVTSPSEAGPPIRIRDLLQHTSGLPDTIPAMIGWVHYDGQARDQTALVRSQLPNFNRLKFPPGERGAYSNLNYMLLGAIIESVTGQAYETYIEDNVLAPLGMNMTGFVVTEEMAASEAVGTLPVVHFYTPLLPTLLDARELIRERQGKLLWLNRVYIDATPSTGLLGPSSDVARLMIALLDGGGIDGERILSRESIEILNQSEPIDGRGIGWSVGSDESGRYLEHPGGGPGFATIMRIYPQENLGVAVLANGTDLDRTGIVSLLAAVDW